MLYINCHLLAGGVGFAKRLRRGKAGEKAMVFEEVEEAEIEEVAVDDEQRDPDFQMEEGGGGGGGGGRGWGGRGGGDGDCGARTCREGNVEEGRGARREKEASNNQEKQEGNGKLLLSTIFLLAVW